MDLDYYQTEAGKTAIYEDQFYPLASLMIEAAELADLYVKPLLRGDNKEINKEEVLAEAGDCLWMLANICSDANLSLSTVALYNLNKLKSRAERGVIQGDGGNR
jgi:NTP pyrophosphatase (non-canonical NTP hydrolase)